MKRGREFKLRCNARPSTFRQPRKLTTKQPEPCCGAWLPSAKNRLRKIRAKLRSSRQRGRGERSPIAISKHRRCGAGKASSLMRSEDRNLACRLWPNRDVVQNSSQFRFETSWQQHARRNKSQKVTGAGGLRLCEPR